VALNRQRCVQFSQSIAASQGANRIEIGVVSRNASKRQLAVQNSLTEALCSSIGVIARKLLEELEVSENGDMQIFRYQNLCAVVRTKCIVLGRFVAFHVGPWRSQAADNTAKFMI
jgi:hypothetical protein